MEAHRRSARPGLGSGALVFVRVEDLPCRLTDREDSTGREADSSDVGLFASLAELEPSDFRYTTYRLADSVTFVHVARVAGTENPLPTLPAFAEFQRKLAQRCVEQPTPSEATVVGTYG